VAWPRRCRQKPNTGGQLRLKILFLQHKVLTQNSVRCTTTPPLFGKLLVGAEPAAARQELRPLKNPKSHRCPTLRTKASLILSIPNYPLSRQGKSLDYGGKAEKAKGYRSFLKVFSENALDLANKKVYNHIVILTMPLLPP